MNIRERVRKAYSDAAERPGDKHPFPVGKEFAKSLGYPEDMLDSLPSTAIDAFAGVSNVAVFAEIPAGSTVLDIGCGAGLDSLIAAKKTGPSGKVISVDFSDTMISRTRQAMEESGIKNVELHITDAEKLPVEDGSIDVILVNGIFNLNPARDKIFGEISRVLKDGCHLYGAELISRRTLFQKIFRIEPAQKNLCSINDPKQWFA